LILPKGYTLFKKQSATLRVFASASQVTPNKQALIEFLKAT